LKTVFVVVCKNHCKSLEYKYRYYDYNMIIYFDYYLIIKFKSNLDKKEKQIFVKITHIA